MTQSWLTAAVVCVHLLSMAAFVAAYFVQRAVSPGGRLVALWAWAVLGITVSGFGLVALSVAGGDHLGVVKMVVKGTLMTVLGVAVLVLHFRRRPANNTVLGVLGAIVLVEVVVSVMVS